MKKYNQLNTCPAILTTMKKYHLKLALQAVVGS